MSSDRVAFDRREHNNPIHRRLGHVVSCNGSSATVATTGAPGSMSENDLWTVGKLVSMEAGRNRIVALVHGIHTENGLWNEGAENIVLVDVEFLGEVRTTPDGRSEFSAGISVYPGAGTRVHRIRSSDLAAVYAGKDGNIAPVGKLSQDPLMDATISIDKLLARHFAIVGTTGVGKSTAVSLLTRKAVERRPDLRVLVLDPHNEYAAAFADIGFVVDAESLDLPFWLFRLEEFAEVLFRGRSVIAEEMELLRDLIPEAKRAFRGAVEGVSARWLADRKSAVTADTPLPYRIADLLALLDQRLGRLEGREEKPHLKSLKCRIATVINDRRFRFMFSSNTIHDTILDTIGTIFRIPGDGRPITVFQLAGIPSEVVNAVASVLCRMAFDIALWGSGDVNILVLCEEAHCYVPAADRNGFHPTRQAIARIAKEGRKYGVSLGVVTQRPGELDATILSQCSTIFAMRLANERDQGIIRSAIPNSSMSALSFLSSIGNHEAIAFGDAVTVPMRMRFSEIETALLPRTANSLGANTGHNDSPVDLAWIVVNLRQIASNGVATNDSGQLRQPAPTGDAGAAGERGVSEYFARTASAAGNDELRMEILRRREQKLASNPDIRSKRTQSILRS